MDINVQAFRLVQQAVDVTAPTKVERRLASKRGGIKGGAVRAASLTSERRKEIARKANAARWSNRKPAHDGGGE